MKKKCPFTTSELSIEDVIKKHDEEIVNYHKTTYVENENDNQEK